MINRRNWTTFWNFYLLEALFLCTHFNALFHRTERFFVVVVCLFVFHSFFFFFIMVFLFLYVLLCYAGKHTEGEYKLHRTFDQWNIEPKNINWTEMKSKICLALMNVDFFEGEKIHWSEFFWFSFVYTNRQWKLCNRRQNKNKTVKLNTRQRKIMFLL